MTATLFAQMGFEAVVLNRIHYALKADFKKSKVRFSFHVLICLSNCIEAYGIYLAAVQCFRTQQHKSKHRHLRARLTHTLQVTLSI